MWLLVEVENQEDVGKCEQTRYIFDKEPQIDGWVGVHGLDIKGHVKLVHPATSEE